VRDEGPGLTAHDREKLFGKFARLSTQPTGGEHSTGLGLSVVKRRTELQNGAVFCESEPGRGANFIVKFPCADAPAAHSNDDEQK
jgi:signal transduction histidine kinase